MCEASASQKSLAYGGSTCRLSQFTANVSRRSQASACRRTARRTSSARFHRRTRSPSVLYRLAAARGILRVAAPRGWSHSPGGGPACLRNDESQTRTISARPLNLPGSCCCSPSPALNNPVSLPPLRCAAGCCKPWCSENKNSVSTAAAGTDIRCSPPKHRGASG